MHLSPLPCSKPHSLVRFPTQQENKYLVLFLILCPCLICFIICCKMQGKHKIQNAIPTLNDFGQWELQLQGEKDPRHISRQHHISVRHGLVPILFMPWSLGWHWKRMNCFILVLGSSQSTCYGHFYGSKTIMLELLVQVKGNVMNNPFVKRFGSLWKELQT